MSSPTAGICQSLPPDDLATRRRPPPFFQDRLSTYEPTHDDAEPSSFMSLTQKPTNMPRSPTKLSICGFLPLPVITASPICTPTSSSSSQHPNDFFGTTTSETTPASDQCPRVLFPPSTPTWIATPPTPPSKSLRRSNTTTASSRRLPFTLFSPSASFPASMHPHAVLDATTGKLRRAVSVPALSARSQHTAEVILSFMDAQLVQSPQAIPDSSIEYPFGVSFRVSSGDIGPITTRRWKESAASHALPIFHLPGAVPTDNEDDGIILCDNLNTSSREEPSPVGSWSDHSIEDIWETERHKDSIRKYHALKELLSTEVGYLVDLRFLVTVYLRSLPTLVGRTLASSNTFGRASSSFTTGPWIQTYNQAQAQASTGDSSSTTLSDTHDLSTSTSSTPKEPAKPNSRYIFSDQDVELLTRNAEEILQLHEQFVRELRIILEPLGYSMEHDEDDHSHEHLANLDAALRAVSTKFATEASRFNAYQSFCAGHPEAMDALRKAYQQFPVELDAFEQRCSSTVAGMMENASLSEPHSKSSRSSSDSPAVQSQTLTVEDRKRAMSLTSLDCAVRALRPRSSMNLAKDSVVFPTEPKRDRTSRRIVLMDYMIKPIQRICKYPLLFDQLLPSKALRTLSPNGPDSRSGVDVVVKSAAQAMKHVASSVDEARHRQDVAIQSGLIFSRMTLGLQSISSSGSPSSLAVTTEFLSSLGHCLLSGSLDVMHYHPNRPLDQASSIKARYFGAFLYSGGYLILVKVSKGKKYEPKHWFSLADFEISDVGDDCAMLPCSFLLSCGDQHFELAASCQREKDAWLRCIHDSRTLPAAWTNEPTPSFKFDGKGELLPAFDDGNSESPNGLSTIRSIPEFGNLSDAECSEPFFSLRPQKSKKKWGGYEGTLNLRQEVPPPPTRRSSTTSVKNIFSPMATDTETVLIRRSSPVARHQVDLELQDVISQSCQTARSYAFSHEMELFQAPRATKTGFSRSNSGMGMRLSKHESVRVPRRKTTESLESVLSRGAPPAYPTTSGRRNVKKLSIASISLKDFDGLSPGSATTSPYPSPPSSHSSRAAAARSSNTDSFTTPTPQIRSCPETSPTKPRSFVRNVKGLFHFRPVSPASPVSVIVSQPSQNSIQSPASVPDQSGSPYSMLHRWTIRRRTRSVPKESADLLDDPEKTYPIATPTVTPLLT